MSPDGRFAVAVDIKGGVGCWELATGDPRTLPKLPEMGRPEAAGFSPDGTHLVLGGRERLSDGSVDLIVTNLRDQRVQTHRAEGQTQSATAVAFDPDGQLLAVGT